MKQGRASCGCHPGDEVRHQNKHCLQDKEPPDTRGHRGNQGLHPAGSLLCVQGLETKPDETPSLKGDPWGVLGVGGHACWVGGLLVVAF